MKGLSEDWASRAELPSHVVTMLNNFPAHLHPMAQFSAACAALNSESKFAKVRKREPLSAFSAVNDEDS